jgi:4-aminobutyrate aminotransferase-like enzyme
MESADVVNKVVEACLEKGIITFWFLSHPYSFRLSPPLTISMEETQTAINIIKDVIQKL